MQGRALYYPYLSIQDSNWLKAALLHWEEGVERIVPYPSLTRFEESSPDICMAAEAGLVSSVSPFDVLEIAESEFLRRYRDVLAPAEVRGKRVLDRLTSGLDREEWMLKAKMTGSLLNRLTDAGIARDCGDGTVEMAGPYLLAYMCILGNALARQRQEPLVSEQRTLQNMQLAANSIGTKVRSSTSNRFTILARLDIAFPLPEQLARVPMVEILAFNRQNRSSIKAFRRFTTGRLKNLLALESGEFETQLKDFKSDIDDMVRDHQREMRFLTARTWLGTITAAIPIAQTVAEHVAGVAGPAWPALLEGTTAFAGLTLEHRFSSANLRKAPASYVLALHRFSALRARASLWGR